MDSKVATAVIGLAAACGSQTSTALVASAPVASAPVPAASGPMAPPPSSAAAPIGDPAALDSWVDRELAPRVPSAVIGLADAGGLRWHRAVGSRDARGGPAPDRATIYRIGSLTKLFTGTAVVQLRDAGKLTLDDPVARWVPELAAVAGSITVRHLVSHTSGIPSLGDGSAVYWEQQPPSEADLLRALLAPLAFAPGTSSAYSNAGMALAGVIAARAAGEPYRAMIAHRLLEPLAMRGAAWDRAAVPVDRLAIGAGAGGAVDPPHWQLGAFEPAGGLYLSLDDMVAFARLALGGFPGVLAPTSLAEMMRDDPLPGPHGVAWIAGREGGLAFAAHTGSTLDYSASLVVVPERGLAAIVLAAGPEADLVECAAAAVLRSAATGAPLGSCARRLAPEQRAAAEAALTRLRALLARPERAAIEAAFEPAFLAQVPAPDIADHLTELTRRLGRCDRHELTGAGAFGARAVLHCERGTLAVELSADPASPHRIGAILFP